MTAPATGAQLELVRRVGVPALDEALLRTPPVGRGHPDPTGEQVTDAEVLRVAVGFLAARLAAAVSPEVTPTARRGLLAGLRRRRHRPYVVLGRSLTAEVVRGSLAAAGGVEGGRHPVAIVVGDDLPGLVQGRWTRSVRGGSGQRWRRAWSLLECRESVLDEVDAMPAPVPSARETHGLLLPPDPAVRVAAGLVGLAGRDSPLRKAPRTGDRATISQGTIPPEETTLPLPARYDPARVDLLRRIHQALATRLPRAERARVAAVLDTWLPPHEPHRLAPPPEHAEWAVTFGHRLADRLTAGLHDSHESVTLHGEPGFVVPSSDVSSPRTVPAAAALDRALLAIRASAADVDEGSH